MKRSLLFLVTVTALWLFSGRYALALDCNNAQTTVDMIECADKEYRAADQKLNQSYSAFKKSLDAPGNALLLEAQRAWLKFRDTNCALAADQARGGTMAPLLEIGCRTSMTEQRTKELDEWMKGLGQ